MKDTQLPVLVSLETLERRHITRVLKLVKGNLSRAARILDIDRRTLYRKIEKYNRKRRIIAATIEYSLRAP